MHRKAGVPAQVEAQAAAWDGQALSIVQGEWDHVRGEAGRLSEAGRGLGDSLGRAFQGAVLGGRSFSDILKQLEGDLPRLLESSLFGAGGVGGFLGGGLGVLLQGATAGTEVKDIPREFLRMAA